MQRKSNAANIISILLAVALLTITPVLVSGFSQLERARLAELRSDHDTAYEAYALAAQRLPWRADLWERAGVEAFQAGLSEQAISFLQRSPHPSQSGLVVLGQAYQQAGQPGLARQAFQAALKQGASAQVFAGLAALDRLDGDLEAERAALQNQLLLQPDDAAAQYRLGLLLSLSDLSSAATHLQMAAQLDANYDPVWQTLRSALALAGISPTDSGRLVTLGRALGLVGEWRLAQQAFQQAVGADGQDALAWAWLGEARQQLGQDAASELDKAVALDPHSVVIRGLRGLYWKRLGNERNALQEYQAAAFSDPQNPAWPASLGETYARLGDLVSALQSYDRATQLAPRDSLYWRLLATFCLEYNLQVETIGLPAAERAQQLAPDDPLAVDVLGWSQLAAGRPWEAVQTLPRALELAPDFALAHYHLALAYLQTGERTAAYNQLKLAIDLDPGGSVGSQASQLMQQQFP